MLSAHLSVSLALLFSIARAAPSLTDILSTHQNLTQLNSYLSTSLPDYLKNLTSYTSSNPITFLAPSDDAFGRLPYTSIIGPAYQNNDTNTMTAIFEYHTLPGMHTSKTLNGTFAFLDTMLDGRNWTNVTGSQRIGAVLQGGSPPAVVFVSGDSTRSVVNTTGQDIEFEGGIIQVIDSFALPPQPISDTIELYDLSYPPQSMTSFLGALYSFSSTTHNLSLAAYLNTTTDVTVFVPHNLAFETVSANLTALTPADLANILSYHVVPGGACPGGPCYSTALQNGTVHTTLQQHDLTVTFAYNSLFVNSARVLATDLLISNGVLHVIDNVLDPLASEPNPQPTIYSQLPVLPTTLGTASFNESAAPFTSDLPELMTTAASNAATSTAGLDGAAAGTTTAGGSSPTSTKKSDASRPRDAKDVQALLGLAVLAGPVLIGAIMML